MYLLQNIHQSIIYVYVWLSIFMLMIAMKLGKIGGELFNKISTIIIFLIFIKWNHKQQTLKTLA